MPSQECFVVNAFVDQDQGGNPAGVVLHADNLSQEEKQHIAKRIEKPETAFVSASEKADFKVEFFSPSEQIPHCGHATVAAFSLLKAKGMIDADQSSKEPIKGEIRQIRFTDGKVFLQQDLPVYQELSEDECSRLLKPIGLTNEEIDSKTVPIIASTGNRFFIAGLKSNELLASIISPMQSPSVAKAVASISREFELVGYYLFTFDGQNAGRLATSRMFAPAYDIFEEAATGTGAAPLACVLFEKSGIKETKMTFEQGCLMPTPSPSLLEVIIQSGENGKISEIWVGGLARFVESLRIEY